MRESARRWYVVTSLEASLELKEVDIRLDQGWLTWIGLKLMLLFTLQLDPWKGSWNKADSKNQCNSAMHGPILKI